MVRIKEGFIENKYVKSKRLAKIELNQGVCSVVYQLPLYLCCS